MLSPSRTALYLVIGAMAIVASEANAGCKVISGSYVCATWIKGSTDCLVESDGNKMIDAECIITGVAEYGEEPTTYCASGELPLPECIAEEEFSASSATSASAGFRKAAAKKKLKNYQYDDREKNCKPWHDGKHDDKHVGHNDSCSGLSGDEYRFLEMTDPRCTRTGPGIFDCSASGTTSLPQEGGFCEEYGTYGNSAAKMLAIAFACVRGGGGGTVCNYDDPIIDYCTLNEDGNYDCEDISGQNPSPLDPSCSDYWD